MSEGIQKKCTQSCIQSRIEASVASVSVASGLNPHRYRTEGDIYGHNSWSPDMRLGLPRIDAAHESFLRALAELAQCDDTRFCAAFLELVARVERDFHEEEMKMEEVDYADLACHREREQHARVLGALHHVTARVMVGEAALGREAVSLLPQWFLLHLSTMDTALALTLELHRSERASALHVPRAQ